MRGHRQEYSIKIYFKLNRSEWCVLGIYSSRFGVYAGCSGYGNKKLGCTKWAEYYLLVAT
jgi:hypothetical protein